MAPSEASVLLTEATAPSVPLSAPTLEAATALLGSGATARAILWRMGAAIRSRPPRLLPELQHLRSRTLQLTLLGRTPPTPLLLLQGLCQPRSTPPGLLPLRQPPQP